MLDELSKKIEDLEGIISYKVTGKEKINEIHIIADKSRKPKRIVRDVETMVLVNLDYEINHKKISIAQISAKENESSRQITIISIYQEHNGPVCNLKLSINDNVVEERIEGSPQEPIELIVARGVSEIIEKYTDFSGKLRVENVFQTGINNEILIVQLILHNQNFTNQERLIGAVYIDNNLPLAAGKACLKALNRRFLKY